MRIDPVHTPIRLLVLAGLFLAGPSWADVVHLKGGGQVEGQVVERGDHILVRLPSGEIQIPRDRIERIEKKRSIRTVYETKRQALDAAETPDAGAYYRLGLWCRFNGLAVESRKHLERAIAIDTDHAGARAELGHERVEGGWLTGDEDRRARGLVRFEGRWMTPEAVASLLAARGLEKRMEAGRDGEREEKGERAAKVDPPKPEPKRISLTRSIRPTRFFREKYFAGRFPSTSGSPVYGRIHHGTTLFGYPLGKNGFYGYGAVGPLYYGPYPYKPSSGHTYGPSVYGPFYLYPKSYVPSGPTGGLLLEYRNGSSGSSKYWGFDLGGSSQSGPFGSSSTFGGGLFGNFQWKGGSLQFDTR